MCYGEELGMVTATPTRHEDVKDPIGITGWPKEKGRDGERTPMQWDSSKDAGFSDAANTWLPVASGLYNRQRQDRGSRSQLSPELVQTANCDAYDRPHTARR